MTVAYCVLIITLAVWIARLTAELKATREALEVANESAIQALENAQ